MMDGWMLRQRGDDWSLKPADGVGERGAWQECKSAVLYRLPPAVKKTGRGRLVEKLVVASLGDPLEFGRRGQAAARRRGPGQAPQVFVVADGAGWVWNLAADRFATATGALDFYPASQQLWAVAHTLPPENETAAQAWVEPLLHQLRHGGEADVLQTLHALPAWCAQRAQPLPPTVATETNGFEQPRDHRHHAALAAARPLHTGRPVLDCPRSPPPHAPRKRPPQPRLAPSLAAKLRTGSRCTRVLRASCLFAPNRRARAE